VLPDDFWPDSNPEAWQKHFEALSNAIPRVDVTAPAPSMPLSAPDWLWEAMEAHLEKMEALEIVWAAIERTFAQIRELPDTAPGACPAAEEYVWTREEIDKDRDFEGGSYDDGWDDE
jgi:hypothetical protein